MLGCYCIGTVCSLEEVPEEGSCRGISNEELLELPVDILIPSAKTWRSCQWKLII